MTSDPTTPLANLPGDEQPTIHRAPGSDDFAHADGFTPGAIVAQRYRIVALLGRGGMGEVYRADDLRLGQPVALKFLTRGDRQAIETIYHEVRIARQVSHPNVCRVHDVVEADGLRFIAMEYVDGEDLASLLRRIGRLPPNKALEVAKEIASGLAAAHDRGIIHRDLKPGNVMIDGKGRAHVTDFGLASLAGLDDKRIAGTPAYMAPEQVAGTPVTLRSDVYSLGLVLYEIFTGDRVYDSGSFADRRREPPRNARKPSSIVRDIDPEVDRVIMQCLEHDPDLRPASARSVLAMLPGGDALDAALAAGETPSPEMVAAATDSGALPMRVVLPLLAAIIVVLAIGVPESSHMLFSLVRKPPEVLIERAEDVIARAGERSEPRDQTYTFEPDLELLRSPFGKVPREAIARTRPGVVHFVYRRAPQRLIAQRIGDTQSSAMIFRSGEVTIDDPPVDTPGNAAIVLDQNAALVEYRARPSEAGGSQLAANWTPLLEATGIDLRSLQRGEITAVAPVASTERVAWDARYPKDPRTAHIEAASLGGRPSWLRVYGSWQRRDAPPPANIVMSGPIVGAQLALMVLSMIGAIMLARRNIHRGRGDLRGGTRLATFVAAVLLLSWLIAAHHANNGYEEARMLSQGVGEACGSAAVLWLCYVALEPAVRRRWPRALIGWTRLLAGRFSDPMVAREALFGIAAGILGFELLWANSYLFSGIGRGYWHLVHGFALNPLSMFAGNVFLGTVDAIEFAMGSLFLFLLIVIVVRRTRVAYAIWIAMCAAATIELPGAAVYVALLLFMILRLGLLTGVVSGFTVWLLFNSPLTFDANAWYFQRSCFVLAMLTLGALWAARNVVGEAQSPARAPH
jgi:serine/threonine-protein kinase